jgi:amino acid transporter
VDSSPKTHDAAHPRDRLKRELSLWDAVMLVIASVIGSGIFFTPGQVAALLPDPLWILAAWLVIREQRKR